MSHPASSAHEPMRPRDLLDLVALGGIWGGSFLFMRISVPEFGPVVLIALRVSIAAAMLTALLAARGNLRSVGSHAGRLALLGSFNTAIPFTLFAFATLRLPAGFSSVLNATVPLFGAIVGLIWLRQRLGARQSLGLVIGFAGVVVLVLGKAHPGATVFGGDGVAIAAGLSASLLYGIAAHYTKRHFAGVPPLVIATGTQLASSLMLLPLALYYWPATRPSLRAFLCALTLGLVCTGLAYLLYFRLLAHVGPTRSMTVTYLIPVFGMIWGALFLSERITLSMIVGCAIILLGIASVTTPRKPPAEPSARSTV